eukprot:CAMPEP_0119387440 /NCGR_PEP_ID=MMETSP1334-20130426/100707_1 /TAXON_ID=127549 /ORGANISM="Calcidiscus leptoporus, Strain RCC1130" /LENGTH=43 /DNA_ID= /DNA_START= /DNA_END= /DNA_ORIENTATION=
MKRFARSSVAAIPSSRNTPSTACFCEMRLTPCVGSAAAELKTT